MRRWLPLLAALALCLTLVGRPVPAFANVAIAQAYSSGTGPTCVLAGAPTAGQYVIIVYSGNTATDPAFKDSATNSLTQLAASANSTSHSWAYGYSSPGGTTATFSGSASAGAVLCLALSGANSATVLGVSGTVTAGTSLVTSPVSNVLAGGISLVMEQNTAGTAPSSQTVGGNSVTGAGNTVTRSGYFQNGATISSVAGVSTFGSNVTGTTVLVTIWPTATTTTILQTCANTASGGGSSLACTFSNAINPGTVILSYDAELTGASGCSYNSVAMTFEGAGTGNAFSPNVYSASSVTAALTINCAVGLKTYYWLQGFEIYGLTGSAGSRLRTGASNNSCTAAPTCTISATTNASDTGTFILLNGACDVACAAGIGLSPTSLIGSQNYTALSGTINAQVGWGFTNNTGELNTATITSTLAGTQKDVAIFLLKATGTGTPLTGNSFQDPTSLMGWLL